MAEFKAITTQEELDSIIDGRLKREREKYAGFEEYKQKAADYDKLTRQLSDQDEKVKKLSADLAAANATLKGHDDEVSGLKSRAEKAERELLQSKIANECGIPFALAGRLSGTTEEEMRKDAEALTPYLKNAEPAPLASTEPGKIDATAAMYTELLQNLKGV